MPTLETVLGARNLTGLIQATKPKVVQVLGDEWLRPTKKVHGNTAEFFSATGNRTTARVNQYGAASKRTRLRNIAGTPTVLIHSLEDVTLNAQVLVNLLSPDSEDQGQRQQLGVEEVQRQVDSFKDRYYNLRVTVTQMLALTGQCYFDDDGKILPSSAGAAFTMDAGIPAANKGTIALATGNLNGWATASTDIIGQLIMLQQLALKNTGYEITEAYYGASIPTYIAANTTAQQFLRYNLKLAEAYTQKAMVPPGFGDIDIWKPAWKAFYASEDANGAETINEYFPATSIMFCATPTTNWYDFVEGSYVVPRELGAIGSDSVNMLSKLGEEFGYFSYAKVLDDPVGIKMFAGDTFAPQIRNGKVIYIATVN